MAEDVGVLDPARQEGNVHSLMSTFSASLLSQECSYQYKILIGSNHGVLVKDTNQLIEIDGSDRIDVRCFQRNSR